MKEAYIKAVSIGAVLAVIAFLCFSFSQDKLFPFSEMVPNCIISLQFGIFMSFCFYICQFYAADYVEFFTAIGKPKVGSFWH